MTVTIWDGVAKLLPPILAKNLDALSELPMALMEPAFHHASFACGIKSPKRSRPSLGVWDVPLPVQEAAEAGVLKGCEVGKKLFEDPPAFEKGALPYMQVPVKLAINRDLMKDRLRREKDAKGYTLMAEGFVEVGLYGGRADDSFEYERRSEELREQLRSVCESAEDHALVDVIEDLAGNDYSTKKQWFEAIAAVMEESICRVKKHVKVLAARLERDGSSACRVSMRVNCSIEAVPHCGPSAPDSTKCKPTPPRCH